MSVNLIVAIGKDGAIGKKGDLIWKISEDLKRFKALTTGHPVIMGRKTWESLPKRPLPHRKNIILTHNNDYSAEGAEIVHSVGDAIKLTEGENPFIIGGAEVYKAFLPYTSHLYLTEVDAVCPQADAFLNINTSKFWRLIEESPKMSTPAGFSFRYLTYEKADPS